MTCLHLTTTEARESVELRDFSLVGVHERGIHLEYIKVLINNCTILMRFTSSNGYNDFFFPDRRLEYVCVL